MSRSATVCILTLEFTAEMEKSIPVLLDSGFQVRVASTGADPIGLLSRFLSNRKIPHLKIAWTGDHAAAFNSLTEGVTEGWIIRLDSDEWIEREQARALRAYLDRSSPNVAFRLQSRNCLPDRDCWDYTETRPTRIWPAEAGLRYVGYVGPHLVPEEISVRTGQESVELPVYYWHRSKPAGELARRTEAFLVRVREGRRLEPENFDYRVAEATNLAVVRPDEARPLILELAEEVVQAYRAGREPRLAEYVIFNAMRYLSTEDPTGKLMEDLERIASEFFDRSMPLLSTRLAIEHALDHPHREWELAMRIYRLAKTNGFRVRMAAHPDLFRSVSPWLLRAAERLQAADPAFARSRVLKLETAEIRGLLVSAEAHGFDPQRPTWKIPVPDEPGRPYIVDWKARFWEVGAVEAQEGRDLSLALRRADVASHGHGPGSMETVASFVSGGEFMIAPVRYWYGDPRGFSWRSGPVLLVR